MFEVEHVDNAFGSCRLAVDPEASMVLHQCFQVPCVSCMVGPYFPVTWLFVRLDRAPNWCQWLLHEVVGSIDVRPYRYFWSCA